MAVTLTITGGTMKIEGVYPNPVFVTGSNSNFVKNQNDEYSIYDKILGKDYDIGASSNVNGGIADAALEALLSGFFSSAGGGAGAVDSFNSRIGAVVPADGDYSKSLITGLKDADSVTFGGLTVNNDSDGTTILGRAKVGSIDPDTACFGHFDRFTAADATLQIAQGGDSILKCSTSKTIKIQQANTTMLEFESDRTTAFKGGEKHNLTTVNSGTYSLLATDFILHVTYTSTGSSTITLPTAQTVGGRVVVIKDTGNAATNNITIETEGAQTIDGLSSWTIAANYDSVTMYSDGSNWFII